MPSEIIRPTGRIGVFIWVPVGAGGNAQCIQEVVPDDYTTYVKAVEAGGTLTTFTDRYTLGDPTFHPSATITAVTIRYRYHMEAAGITKDLHLGFYMSAVDYWGATRTSTGAPWATVTDVFAVSPATGVAWTKSELTNAGLSNQAMLQASLTDPAECDLTWAEVQIDYTLPPPRGVPNAWDSPFNRERM